MLPSPKPPQYAAWPPHLMRACGGLRIHPNIGMLLGHVIGENLRIPDELDGDEALEPRDPSPCRIDLDELAERFGAKPAHTRAAYAWLLQTRILKEKPQGVVVNLRVDQWVRADGSGPLLRPHLRDWALAAMPTPI